MRRKEYCSYGICDGVKCERAVFLRDFIKFGDTKEIPIGVARRIIERQRQAIENEECAKPKELEKAIEEFEKPFKL